MNQQAEWKELEDSNTYDMKSWRTRVGKLASYINDGIRSVMDLGCGERYLEVFLNKNDIEYYPVDYISRGDGTIICDFNNKEFPVQIVDCVFVSGCLEYVKDLDWFINKIVNAAQKQIVVSYTAFEYFPFEKLRREKAYQHDLPIKELVYKFYRWGFMLCKFENTTCALMSFERMSPKNLVKQSWCVNCGLCSNHCISICPLISSFEKKENKVEQEWWTLDSIETDGSDCNTLLYVLAQIIFKLGGIILYPAYDGDKKTIEYKEADTIEHIKKSSFNFLSKVKSRDYYRHVENLLNSTKMLFFISVACEIASLKQYLDSKGIENLGNLICIEVSQKYLPSADLLEEYLNTSKDFENITDINSRNVNGKTIIEVTAVSGEKEIISSARFPYISGMNKALFISKACENCTFKGKNYGDILIERSKKDKWMFTCPTERGQQFLKLISKDIRLNEEKNDISTKVVRKRKNLLRDRFFSLKERMPFEQALTYTLNKKWDIVYVGWYGIKNYGAELTHFALYSYLQDNGYEVLMAQTPSSARRKPSEAPQLFKYNPYKAYDIAKIYKSKSEMYELNAFASIFMVGSDQLWKKSSFDMSDRIFDLEYIKSDKSKIAYSTSFGYEYYLGDEHDVACMKKNLKQFNAISVREESGIKLCQDLFDIDAVRCMDPVFLCDKQHYIEQASSSNREFKNCISGFFLDLLPEKLQLVEELARRLGKSYYIATDPKKQLDQYEVIIEKDFSVEDWIKMIKESDYIITDSMHASCLSIIFGKKFVTIANEKGRVGSKDRIYSLFSILDLMERAIEDCINIDNIQSIIEADIDYELVFSKLEEEVRNSKKWLLQTLKLQKKDITEEALLWEEVVKNAYNLEKLIQTFEELGEKSKRIEQQIEGMIQENKKKELALKNVRQENKELEQQVKNIVKENKKTELIIENIEQEHRKEKEEVEKIGQEVGKIGQEVGKIEQEIKKMKRNIFIRLGNWLKRKIKKM